MDTSPQPTEQQKAAFNKGCLGLLLLLIIGVISYYGFKSYHESKERENQILYDTPSGLAKFYKDSSDVNRQHVAIAQAAFLITELIDSSTKSNLKDWLIRHHVSVDSIYKDKADRESTMAEIRSKMPQVSTDYGDEEDLHSEACIMAKDFVKMKLKSPSSAEFDDANEYWLKIGSNTYRVKSSVDAQNGFGAVIRNRYLVELKFNGGDWRETRSWTALKVEVFE